MPVGELEYQEALHSCLMRGKVACVARAHLGLGKVVLRDLPAYRDAGEIGEVLHDGISHRAPDIIKVNVDPERACGGNRFVNVLRLVIDAGVKAEFIHDEIYLFLRPGRSNNVAAHYLRNLAYDLPNCTRCRRNEDGLPGLRPAHIKKAEVGGHTWHSQNAKRSGEGTQCRVNTAQVAPVRDGILLPAQPALHNLAHAEGGSARFDDPPYGTPDHHITQLNRGSV